MYSAEKPDDIDRFFRGLTEHAFHARLGVVDPPLVDYVATLLIRSMRSDQLPGWPSNVGPGRPDLAGSPNLVDASDLASDEPFDELHVVAALRHEQAAGEGFRQLGDSALFWTGIYPEALHRPNAIPGMPIRPGAVPLVTYRLVGKRAYRLASALTESTASFDRSVLERLSDEFDLCAEGLSEVRKAWSERG